MTEVRNKKSVFVGLSGGVDSSVAAYLLKKGGYDVVGIFMRCFNVDGCQAKDVEDARRVAAKLEIPFYVWDFEAEYKRRVVDYMIEGYRAGITPNPDVACNREIKFGLFLEKALKLGADFIATGHYARLRSDTSEDYHLLSAKDKNKDQTYFLWTLTQDKLKHCLFPVGDYLKSEVRKIALEAGLPTANKKDSQGVCFLGQITLSDFLGRYLPHKKGEVINAAGEKLGSHPGSYFYTIGQRRGVGNIKHQTGVTNHRPLYVVKKDVIANTVTVADVDDPSIFKNKIHLTHISYVGREVASKEKLFVRTRYRQSLVPATVITAKNDSTVEFIKPQKFIAPGQSAVFYSTDGELLGGGVIIDR